MKFNFKLKNIEIAEVKIGAVEVETEFSINEMIEIRKEVELGLARTPIYLEQLATGYKRFVELNSEVEDFEKAHEHNQMVKAKILNDIIKEFSK